MKTITQLPKLTLTIYAYAFFTA